MIEVQPHVEGTVLLVRAQPGARVNAVRGEQDGALKVSVTQIAEKGRANKAITEVLANSLGLRRSQIELLVGETSAHKRFLIRGITVEALRERLRTLAGK